MGGIALNKIALVADSKSDLSYEEIKKYKIPLSTL
jgi:fatty acid-binding protein DegV